MALNEGDFWIFVRDFIDYLNAQEGAVKRLKEQNAKLMGKVEGPKRKWSWNPDKIKWRMVEGFKEEYERS